MTTINKTTVREKVLLATQFMEDINSGESNVYVGIGHNKPWNSNDTFVEPILESTDYINQLMRNLVAIKKIFASNINLVTRRQDWVSGTVYDAYANNVEMYSYTKVVGANGTASTQLSSLSIVGVGTTFTKDFENGTLIQFLGDGSNTFPQQKEVNTVISDTLLTVNTSFSYVYTANSPQALTNTFPNFVKNFYVRNTYDQVFVCLSNNNSSASNTMPQITLGGQLPSDPYIITADGYNWKYLYTIPSGLKQKFFTQDWMPIYSDTNVLNSVVNGRLDIIDIVSGGRGYNNSTATFSAPILTVVGDGSGANLTAQVDSNGTIQGVNILNAGALYTVANIVVATGQTGANANLIPIIGPQGGWGSNTAYHLGATTLMVSVDLKDTENGTIPTTDSQGDFFTYRQVAMIVSPLTGSGSYASSINYDLTTQVTVSGNVPFAMNDLVFQSNTGLFANATFYGTVVYFDNNSNILHLNNVSGTVIPQGQIYGTKSAGNTAYGVATVFSQNPLQITPFSGSIQFMENRLPVSRYPNQAESVRFVIQF